MSNIPTAEEICSKQFFGFKGELWIGVHKAMIEFAKLHVEAALKAAAEESNGYTEHCPDFAILTIYPPENIK